MAKQFASTEYVTPLAPPSVMTATSCDGEPSRGGEASAVKNGGGEPEFDEDSDIDGSCESDNGARLPSPGSFFGAAQHADRAADLEVRTKRAKRHISEHTLHRYTYDSMS